MSKIIQCGPEDAKALDECIERWKRIVEIGGSERVWYSQGVPGCALCLLCDSRPGGWCESCIISEDTGAPGCRNLPYVKAGLGNPEAQQAMLDYLIDLKGRLEVI
jgi:hypothetical protein